MEGLTKKQIDAAESQDFAIGKGPLRPRDAATLILLDRSGPAPRVLLGRRHSRHTFMPGRFVFPGGRTDPADSRVSIAADLHPAEASRIAGAGSRATLTRSRAIALSAVRETYEEAGILIGHKGPYASVREGWQGFADNGIAPALDRLRFVARAITPPGRVRRYDTRFLAAFRDDVALELPEGGPTDELEELAWLTIAEAVRVDIPPITRTVLKDIERRLSDDPDLAPGGPAPFYRMVRNRFVRELL